MNSKTYGSIILISERAAPSVLTLLLVLISAEHEIFSADKYENANYVAGPRSAIGRAPDS